MEVNYSNSKTTFLYPEQIKNSMNASRATLTGEIRKLFHICLEDTAKPEVELDTIFGKLRLKTRPASPNLVHIVYLNGARVYKILTQDLVGVSKEELDAFLDERLQRPSFGERLHKALLRPIARY